VNPIINNLTKSNRNQLEVDLQFSLSFVSELFNQSILTQGVVFSCLELLFNYTDKISGLFRPCEERVEAGLKLLTKVGRSIDADENASLKASKYFALCESIVNEKLFSSRIRFIAMDLIELRKV
jgi:hypothetical protein